MNSFKQKNLLEKKSRDYSLDENCSKYFNLESK